MLAERKKIFLPFLEAGLDLGEEVLLLASVVTDLEQSGRQIFEIASAALIAYQIPEVVIVASDHLRAHRCGHGAHQLVQDRRFRRYRLRVLPQNTGLEKSEMLVHHVEK